mgnify:CR=1 FL=1|jgi:hypothetical protein
MKGRNTDSLLKSKNEALTSKKYALIELNLSKKYRLTP